MARAGYINAVTAYTITLFLIETANPIGVSEDGCHRNVQRYSQKLAAVGKTRILGERITFMRLPFIYGILAQLAESDRPLTDVS